MLNNKKPLIWRSFKEITLVHDILYLRLDQIPAQIKEQNILKELWNFDPIILNQDYFFEIVSGRINGEKSHSSEMERSFSFWRKKIPVSSAIAWDSDVTFKDKSRFGSKREGILFGEVMVTLLFFLKKIIQQSIIITPLGVLQNLHPRHCGAPLYKDPKNRNHQH